MTRDRRDQSFGEPAIHSRRRPTGRRIVAISLFAVPLLFIGVVFAYGFFVSRGLSKELSLAEANVHSHPGRVAIPAAGSALLWGRDTVGNVSRVTWPPGSVLQEYAKTAVFVHAQPRQPGFGTVPLQDSGLVAILAGGRLGDNERVTIKLTDTLPSDSVYWVHGSLLVESAPRAVALYVRRK